VIFVGESRGGGLASNARGGPGDCGDPSADEDRRRADDRDRCGDHRVDPCESGLG
jgi:hypothetical protein